jgi:hypothetical protein
MNKIELLLSWGFERAPSNGVEFYRKTINDKLGIEVYTSFHTFGIDQVDLVAVNDDGGTFWITLDKIDSMTKVRELIELL